VRRNPFGIEESRLDNASILANDQINWNHAGNGFDEIVRAGIKNSYALGFVSPPKKRSGQWSKTQQCEHRSGGLSVSVPIRQDKPIAGRFLPYLRRGSQLRPHFPQGGRRHLPQGFHTFLQP